jgi:hypothetical protein
MDDKAVDRHGDNTRKSSISAKWVVSWRSETRLMQRLEDR